MTSSPHKIWSELEEISSEETSFSSPRGKEPLLSDWAQKPVAAPRSKMVRSRGVISPVSSPDIMSPTQSPLRTLSPALLQAFSPSRRLENAQYGGRAKSRLNLSDSSSNSPVMNDVCDRPSTSFAPHEAFSPQKTPKSSPIQQVIAEVHASPAASSTDFKETVIEMEEKPAVVPRPRSRVTSAKPAARKSVRTELGSSSVKISSPSRQDKSVAESSLDFFVKSWSTESPRLNSPEPTISGVNAGSPEQARFTLEEYFGPGLPQLIEYHDPEDIPVLSKPGLLYSPSNNPVLLDDKIGEKEPRFLEEEGIYVGVRPHLPYTTRNKMEKRIISAAKPSSVNWFGEDGELVTVEDAVREVPLRPQQTDEIPDTLKTVFKEAEESRDVSATLGEPVMLELELRSLRLSHHALQSSEQRAARQLHELFTQYERRHVEARAQRLQGRLHALRHARNLLVEQDRDARLHKVREEVREVRIAALREGAHDRSLLAALLSSWARLRDLRTEQGYVSCPVRLRVTRKPEKPGEEISWERELEEMALEMLQEQEWTGEERSEKEVRTLARKMMHESRRPPGEPEVTFQLTDDVEVDLSPSSAKERKRRARVRKQHWSLAVLYNGQEVCSDVPCDLDDQFLATPTVSLPLSSRHWPRTLTVQLRERNGLVCPAKILAELSLPLPARGVTLETASELHLEMTGRGQGGCCHGPCLLPHPAGTLKCRVAWGKEDGHVLQPPDKFWTNQVRPLRHLKSTNQLRAWVNRSKLDPNDPTNAGVMNTLKGATGLTNDEVDLAEFSTEIPNDTRLKVLELRARGETEFCTLRLIPPHERELPPDVLKEFEARRERPESELTEDVAPTTESSLSAHHTWGRRALRRIRARVQLQSRLASRRRQLRDMVTEDLVPDIGTLGLTMVQWLQPARPLRPIRKSRQQLASIPGLEKEATLIVNIVSAFQVPVRRDLDVPVPGSGSSSGGTAAGFYTVAVRPFVEVSLQGSSERTVTADGANPTWNQELQLPIRTDCSSDERIVLHLYDEITTDVLEDERLRGVDTHLRHERAWLGSLSFPLAALQLSSRIDGTFPLTSPPLLGYEREPPLRQFTPATNLESPPSPRPISATLDDTCTFLTVFVTVQPALQPPVASQERLETTESPEVEQQLEQWQAEINANFPGRRVRALVPGPTGKSVCITRFFRPLAPPASATNEGDNSAGGTRAMAEKAARLVSLLPCGEPGNAPDVWLPADQALALGICDPMPRAALLTCLLQGLGIRAWLLLGWGPRAGTGGFVLTRGAGSGGDEAWVWEVDTARRTKLDDPFCPVQLVWALVNQENIWANIQREAGARRLRVDVERCSDWLPAFPPGGLVSVPDTSVQPPVIAWVPTPAELCVELAESLELALRDAFLTWRPHLRTRWNRHCIAVLRRVLPVLEQTYHHQPSAARSLADPTRELQPLLGAHKMVGFPLHLPYTDEASILRALKATKLHEARDKDVEFALAVHVAPLTCRLVCVWLYAASLVRRR